MNPKKLSLISLLFFSMFSYAQLKPVQYSDESQVLNGYKIQPTNKSQQNPGILILPAWSGIDKQAKNTADELANMGYIAFIADIYGEGNYPKDNTDAANKAAFYKKNVINYQKRIALALEQLIKAGANPENIVVIGYCFGGTGALEAARAHLKVKGVVSFHGGLAKDTARTTEHITAKVLVLHAADDPYESKEEIEAFQKEMTDAKADWQMIYYSNAVHAFTNPEMGTDNSKGAAYNELAAKRSFEHFKLFLNEVLKK